MDHARRGGGSWGEGEDPGELVRRAAEGDADAWQSIVERYAGLLWSIAASYRLGRADAADVVQTTWLRLLENLTRLREPERVGAWLATTLRHECLAALRRSGRVAPTDDVALERAVEATALAGGSESPDAGLLRGERDSRLWQAFERLSQRCRDVLRALVVDAEDGPPVYAEVARRLDIPVGSLGPSRARCLELLRRSLQDPDLGAWGEA
jgi:RNA polymerase sigma factor (sigma-70 family)